MDSADVLKKVRKIEIKARGLSQNIFAGQYHSAFKGRGMAFSEVREYQFGDDVRDIDWNVTARMNRPYVKVFEEERELTVMLVVDVSDSGQFGTLGRTHRELAAEIGATLAFSALQNNDKVGALFFSEGVEKFIPPGKGRRHVLYIVRELLNFTPKGRRTNLAAAMEYLTRVMTKRTISFVMSDFLDTRDFRRELEVACRKHDLIGLRLYDPRVAQLPDVGLLRVVDAETGHEQYIDTSNRAFRDYQRRQWEQSQQQLTALFRRSGGGYEAISTDSDFVKPLIHLFSQRGR